MCNNTKNNQDTFHDMGPLKQANLIGSYREYLALLRFAKESQ